MGARRRREMKDVGRGAIAREHRSSPFAAEDLAWLLPGLGATAATVGALFNGLDHTAGKPVACLIAATLLIATLLVIPPRRAFWIALRWPIALLFAGLFWAVLVSLPGVGPAYTPDLVLPEALGLAAMIAVFVAGAAIGAHPHRQRQTIDALILLGAFVAMIGLTAAQTGFAPSDTLWQPGEYARFAGTLGNANVAGTFYAMIAVLAFARAAHALVIARRISRIGLRPVLAAGCCIVAMIACVETASRMATLTALLGMGAAALLNLSAARRWTYRYWLLILGLLLTCTVVMLWADRLGARSIELGRDIGARAAMWTHYAAVASSAPLTGFGMGSFPLVNASHLGDAGAAQGLWGVNAAHNIILQLVITAGLPFAAALLAAVLLVVRGAWRVERGPGGLQTAIFLALSVVAANAMVDIALDVPALALCFFLLLGMLAGGGLAVSADRLLAKPASAE